MTEVEYYRVSWNRNKIEIKGGYSGSLLCLK